MNPLAQAILRGEIKEGSKVSVDYKSGEFLFISAGAKV
jgi:ATP-dependent Clp protease ATP-binding subunit ClpA